MATKDTNYLVAVHKGLDESLEKQVAALPEKFNKQRFLQNCMTVLQDGQADFSKCEAPTVVRTLLKGAFLGLDFFNGECYAIPYGNQCQFQTDYKGEIKLCKRYSSNPIQDIYAKVVREGDKFEEVIENGKQYVNFRPTLDECGMCMDPEKDSTPTAEELGCDPETGEVLEEKSEPPKESTKVISMRDAVNS